MILKGTLVNRQVLMVYRAASWLSRMKGLLALPQLKQNEGLWLQPCPSIHTWFMGYTIDVVFFDNQGTVLKRVEQLKPWRTAACWRSVGCLELPAGDIQRLNICDGETLQWQASE
ncbi:MAG: DUF192 domain-containing protein [Cellvibrionaceae bacterium]